VSIRQPWQDAVLAPEDIAMIRLALTTCSQLLRWAGQHGGPQLQAAIAEVSEAAGISRSPTALGCAVRLAIDYVDVASAPGTTR
jgi:hypothetical protein